MQIKSYITTLATRILTPNVARESFLKILLVSSGIFNIEMLFFACYINNLRNVSRLTLEEKKY